MVLHFVSPRAAADQLQIRCTFEVGLTLAWPPEVERRSVRSDSQPDMFPTVRLALGAVVPEQSCRPGDVPSSPDLLCLSVLRRLTEAGRSTNWLAMQAVDRAL